MGARTSWCCRCSCTWPASSTTAPTSRRGSSTGSSASILLTLTLLLSFTGYLLPWDQLALWAVTVGTNMMGYTPVFGDQVRSCCSAARRSAPRRLLRWYVLHVLMFPFIIVIFMAIHFWRVRKDGGISGPL